MKVWIVLKGKNYEGATIRGVFKKKIAAKKLQEQIKNSEYFIGCDYCILEQWKITE